MQPECKTPCISFVVLIIAFFIDKNVYAGIQALFRSCLTMHAGFDDNVLNCANLQIITACVANSIIYLRQIGFLWYTY